MPRAATRRAGDATAAQLPTQRCLSANSSGARHSSSQRQLYTRHKTGLPRSGRVLVLSTLRLDPAQSMADAGGGWLAHVEPGTGATYYAKGADVRWERPDEACQGVAQWQSRVDPATGATYFYNEATRETSWTPPQEPTLEVNASKGEWLTRRDAASSVDYYYHTVSGATAWTRPSADEPPEPRVLAPSPSASPLKTSPERPAPALQRRVSPQVVAHVPPPVRAEPPAPFVPPARRRSSAPVPPPPLPASPPRPARAPPQPLPASPPSHAVTRASLDTTSDEDTEDESIALSAAPQTLAADYEGHDFPTYAKQHFQMHRKGFFKARTELDKVCRWKQATMKLALLESCCRDADLLAEALQANRNVTGYMGDRRSGKSPEGHRSKLIGQVMRCDALRDEVYCQLVKQTTLNPSAASALRGWELLLSVLATCPPSEQLAPHVGWHFGAHLASTQESQDYTQSVATYAERCLVALPKALRLGCRRERPTEQENEATAKGEGIAVRAYVVDGRHVTKSIDAWTTALDLADALGDELGGVSRNDGLRVFEVSDDNLQERYLDDNERPLDVLAHWARMAEQEKKKRRTRTYRLAYKVRFFFSDAVQGPTALDLHYRQAMQDILDERYPCSLPEACTLAALALQESHGDRDEHSLRVVQGQLERHLPPSSRGDRDLVAATEQRILKLYGKLKGYGPEDSRRAYVSTCRAVPVYGAQYFEATPKDNAFPAQVVLAVTATALLVVDPASRAVLKSFSYGSVVTWGHSSSSFVVVEGDEVEQAKVHFATVHGREMNDLVRAYVEALVPSAGEES